MYKLTKNEALELFTKIAATNPKGLAELAAMIENFVKELKENKITIGEMHNTKNYLKQNKQLMKGRTDERNNCN